MTPREQCEVYEVLGAADASVAWCVKIGSDSGYFAAQLEESAARTLYPDLDYVTAGQVPPNGIGERVDGGYRLSGHWTFGSGSTHADVIATGFLVTEHGKPVMRDGAPQSRIAFAPASLFEVLDTWHSTGLAGSGSNDYRVKNLFVPEAHTIAQDDPPRRTSRRTATSGCSWPVGTASRSASRAGRSMRRSRSRTRRCTSSLLRQCHSVNGRMREWRWQKPR